jgi:hypothetical protein
MDECWEVALEMFESIKFNLVNSHSEAEALVKLRMPEESQTVKDNVAYDLWIMCQQEQRKQKKDLSGSRWIGSF